MQTMSVLICTYNRHELLQLAMCALIEGSAEKPDQVVVVNGGDERADEVVQSFQRHPDIEIKLVKTTNKNLATSRNVGLSHCAGDIIAMTDDDAEVFPDWITQMKRAHREHPEAGAVGGVVLGINTDSLVGKVADLITFPAWSSEHYVRTLPGVNISYKRDAIERNGPQDEALFRGEDVDYNWRVQKLGYKIYFDPAIKVYHYHRPTMRAFFRQHYMYGRAYYLVRRKWADMYCIYPHRMKRLKDLLKAANFLAGLFYQPFLSARLLPRLRDRILALPLLFGVGLMWRGGMVVQGTHCKFQNRRTECHTDTT
jgi:GT2 family glycosyltransferase